MAEPSRWRRFHRFDPYRDVEERRAAERVKAQREESEHYRRLAFVHADPEAKRRQLVRQSQARRAKLKSLGSLPPPFPIRRDL